MARWSCSITLPKILDCSVFTASGQHSFFFEYLDSGRVARVLVGVDHTRSRVILASQHLFQEALGGGRVTLF